MGALAGVFTARPKVHSVNEVLTVPSLKSRAEGLYTWIIDLETALWMLSSNWKLCSQDQMRPVLHVSFSFITPANLAYDRFSSH